MLAVLAPPLLTVPAAGCTWRRRSTAGNTKLLMMMRSKVVSAR
jgi:hypothetical protein